MAYATQQDIIDRYGADLLTRIAEEREETELSDQTISDALTDMAEEIDAYVGARYDLPLPVAPGLLTRLCVDMAVYHLSGDVTREERKERYDNAVRLLIRISNGTVKLGLPAADAPDETETIHLDAADKLFGRDTLAEY